MNYHQAFNSLLRLLAGVIISSKSTMDLNSHLSLHLQALVLVMLTCATPQGLALNLDGSPESYVVYPAWEPCLNGSFSLEFKTEEQHSLLLYLNKGDFLFFELKLLKGGVRLRVNIGEGTMIIRGGQGLSDNKWHSVEVRQDGEVTTLTVDGVEHSKHSPGLIRNYGIPVNNNDSVLYLGGLPPEYQSRKFKSLALPSVVFEPRFRGSIRNFFYRNCGGEPVRPQPLESYGILTEDINMCERGNPCLNGGRCLTTDKGLFCDCSHTEYKGTRCDLQKIPSDATFLGTQYISYNLSSKGEAMISNEDQITLDFRTKQPSSLLFYTGNSNDYITVGLLNGGIFLSVNLGSGTYQTEIRPAHTRFDDNRWHQLYIRRDAKELTRDEGVCYVTIELDGMYREQGSTTGKFVRLSSLVLYVAGSPSTETLAGSRVRTNFKGCMRKVRYQADSIRLDLTELARQRHGLLDVVGDIIFDKCRELVESEPVTFATPESYVTVPTWDRTSLKGSLAFQFRTVEPGGLMMYSNGDRDGKDFFALELLDGHLYLVLDMGSGVQKVKASRLPIADGYPHDVYFEFSENRGYISIDGQKKPFTSPRISDRFDLHGHLYVGGLGPEINVSALPRELWAAMLRLSYVGCLQDLVLNGNQVNLMAAARLQNKTGIVGYCRKAEPQCISHPCNHRGKCVEGWNRFMCDCRATGFVGSVCQTPAVTLRFDGTQFMKVTMSRESVTQAEDISLRFRTMHPSGLLYLTTGQKGGGMELYLEDGVLHLSVDVGSGAKILTVGHTLNDDHWHTVFIKRRVQTVEVALDQDRPVTDEIPGSTFSLVTARIYVGHVTSSTLANADLPGQAQELGLRSVETGHMAQRDEAIGGRHSGFIGSMQSFIFNGNHFFQMAKSGTGEDIEISARFSSDEYAGGPFAVTFKSVDAFAILPRLQVHDKFSVTLQLKTTESDGLILYNGGTEQDFFAIELTHGFLYYVYDMGEGPQRVKANVNQPINDNKWHEVKLLRAETYKQLLRVDDNTPTIDDLAGAKNNRFDLGGHLYVGGVRKTMYPSLPKQIYSHHGFVGCLGSLDLNGYMPNLLKDAGPIHESVGDGCSGPMTKCVNDSCANQGRCVQQWNSYSCDCDMTSYSGPMCKDDSVSYQFGPGPGLMTFTYPEGQEPSTNFESLAFGFKTFQDEAVLLRMDSKSYDDFIQLELVNGNVYLIYNMGTINHPLGNFYQKVNDGRYHVVRFTRAGPNATLQIDSTVPQVKNPTGKQSHSFNNQAYIRIGGKKAGNGSIIQPFNGMISGLVLNGIHIFELAKQKDPKIRFEGVVSLIVEEPAPRPVPIPDHEGIEEMQSTQGRGKRMNPALRRYLFQNVRNVKDPEKMHPVKRLRYLPSNAAKLRVNRSRQAEFPGNYNPPMGRASRQDNWRRLTVLEPNRHKYQTDVSPEDADNHIMSSANQDREVYPFGGHENMEGNEVPHFWSQEKSESTKSLNFHSRVNEVDNRTIYIYNPRERLPDKDSYYDDNYDLATTPTTTSTTTTRKPRCEYSGPLGVKDKPEETVDTEEAAVGIGEGTEEIDETDWVSVNKHFDTKNPDPVHDTTSEDENDDIFELSHPDYYLGNIEEENQLVESVDEDKKMEEEMKKYKAVEETLRQFSELMKNLQTDEKDRDDDDKSPDGDGSEHEEENGAEEEGSGHFLLEVDRQVVRNASKWSERYKLEESLQEEKQTVTILPYVHVTYSQRLVGVVVDTTTSSVKGLDWDFYRWPHTTPREGVTDDIIITGPGSGCQFDDEDDCSGIGSGTDEEIITSVVFIKSTTPTPTTTVKEPPKCVGPECETSSKLQQKPGVHSSTSSPPHPPINGVDEHGGSLNGNGGPKYGEEHEINGDADDSEDSTAQPGKAGSGDKDDDSGINLGLILGITGSVLVAVIVLCIALCKLRSRDEGTYKVDETQNFSALQSKKSAGNGTLASGSESCTGKRGKKKDVKEWYV